MVVEIREVISSRSITETRADGSSTAELKYRVTGTSDEQVVLAKTFETAPVTFNYLERSEVSIENIDHEVWEATVFYTVTSMFSGGGGGGERPDNFSDDDDDETDGLGSAPKHDDWGFDTSGGTMHITHSLETVSSYSNVQDLPAPKFEGGINVSKDEIRGADIIIPKLSFSETNKYEKGRVGNNFVKFLARVTGKTNNAPWRTFAKGEVLFMGCTGRNTTAVKGTNEWGEAEWQPQVALTFMFSCSENIPALDMKPFQAIQKGGHQLLWVYYFEKEDAASGEVTKQPRAAYVERIYDDFDFNRLIPNVF